MAEENHPTAGGLFISYSRQDKGRVFPFVTALRQAGVPVWIDEADIDPLEDFPARIRQGLAQSKALLAWYSPRYAESRYCQKEITAAWIATQRVTRDVLLRLFIVNPEAGVGHIALGDVGRQNFLAAPASGDESSFVEAIRSRLAALSGDFAAVGTFAIPPCFPRGALIASSRFVGRHQELWRLHTALNPIGIAAHEDRDVLVQLSGLGGVGKTLLAAEYARHFGAAYPGGIHWLRAHGFDRDPPLDPAAREHARREQIEHLAIGYGIRVFKDAPFEHVSAALAHKLASGPPYLWVVDDLPPEIAVGEALAGWLAPTRNGHTLVTTRSRGYDAVGVRLEIDVLAPDAAFTLLTRERRPLDEREAQDARDLAEDLGRHALALDVAGELLTTMTFAELRAELVSPDADPLGALAERLQGQLPGGHEKSIVRTLLHSVRRLEEAALDLLRLACVLDGGTPIPFALARSALEERFGLSPRSGSEALTQGIDALKVHSLAAIASGEADRDTYLVHTLVRYALVHGDPAGDEASRLRRRLHQAAVSVLANLLDGATDIQDEALLQRDLSHARHLVAEPRTAEEARLASWLAYYDGERGYYREALAREKQAHPIHQRELGVDHHRALTSLGQIAFWTGQTGDSRTALQLSQVLLTYQQRVLGADHPDTLRTRHNIAAWTGRTGETREALRLSQALLPDQQRVLGADHPDTLRTRHNIASWTGETGEAHEALRLSQALLPDQQRVLGADHVHTLATRHGIAFWTGETGEAREALRLSQALLPDQQRVLGADHPDTLTTRSTIASRTGETGEAHEALRLSQALLPDRQRVLGADHPDTLRTRHNIASWTGETGEAHEALRLSQALLPDRQRVLGADHPDTLKTSHGIAFWTGQTGEAHEALRLSQALLPDRQRVLGADHPDTLTTRNNIAFWTGQTGEVREALRLFQALLPDEQRVFGADHRETLTTRANIAAMTGQTGEVREALRLFQALLPDEQRVFGADHRETLTTRDWIAHLEEESEHQAPAEAPMVAAPPAATPLRNASCPCGSGKRYKHCCGALT